MIRPQQTRDIKPMLGSCWSSIVDDEPTLTQHWFNISCLLGHILIYVENSVFRNVKVALIVGSGR